MAVNVHGPVHPHSVQIKCHDIFSKGWAAYPCSRRALWELCSNNRSSEKSDEPWCGPIFVTGLEDPATFVLVHPLIRVGWADPSLETPNCLFGVVVSVSLLYPLHNSHTLVNLCTFPLLLLFWFSLAFSTPLKFSPRPAADHPQLCELGLFLHFSFVSHYTVHCKPHTAPFFMSQMWFLPHWTCLNCTLQSAAAGVPALSSEMYSSFPLKREPM